MPEEKLEEKLDKEFWIKVGTNRDRGVQNFASEKKLKPETVLAAAILEGFNEDSFRDTYIEKSGDAESSKFRWSFWKVYHYFARRKFRILFCVTMVILLALVAFAAVRLVQGETDRIVVTRKKGIPAYQQISREDIKASSAFRGQREVAEQHPFVARYTVTPLAENSVISEENLLNAELNKQMSNRIILFLPVKSENFGSLIPPNSKIGLLFSPNKESAAKSLVVGDVILLGIEKRDNSLTAAVAVNSEQFQKVADILAVSTIHLIKN